MSGAGKVLAVVTALMAASPLSVAADTAACDIGAIASALSGSDPDTDPVEARKARRNHVTRDRHADVALAESGGKVRPIAVGRLIDEQFARFDPGYADQRAKSRARLDALKLRLDAAQGPGHWLYCSQQIYNDAEWLVEYTAFWPRAAAAMDELEHSLTQPDQAEASGQAADGSWGGCRREFIFRVDSTVDALNGLPPDPVPRLAHPLAFMEALASPADVGGSCSPGWARQSRQRASTAGRNRLAHGIAAQFLFKPAIAAIARENGAAFIEDIFIRRHASLLDAVQNPVTGFWGPSLVIDGTVLALPDLSMTFHIVSYRHGCVDRWPELIDTLLAMKDLSYPFGWKHDGRITTHNAYDVVKLLAHGWRHASPAQRTAAGGEIAKMLETALTESVRPDSTVVFDPDYYETEAAAYYFAVAFLDEAGFWRPERRFWSDDRSTAPGAAKLCRDLKRNVTRLLNQSTLAVGAYQRLQENCA